MAPKYALFCFEDNSVEIGKASLIGGYDPVREDSYVGKWLKVNWRERSSKTGRLARQATLLKAKVVMISDNEEELKEAREAFINGEDNPCAKSDMKRTRRPNKRYLGEDARPSTTAQSSRPTSRTVPQETVKLRRESNEKTTHDIQQQFIREESTSEVEPEEQQEQCPGSPVQPSKLQESEQQDKNDIYKEVIRLQNEVRKQQQQIEKLQRTLDTGSRHDQSLTKGSVAASLTELPLLIGDLRRILSSEDFPAKATPQQSDNSNDGSSAEILPSQSPKASSDSCTVTRKRQDYSQESMQNALQDVRTNTFSIRKAAQKHGVPEATVRNTLKEKYKNPGRLGAPTYLSTDHELIIKKWLEKCARQGFPLIRRLLVETVRQFVAKQNLTQSLPEYFPGKKWISKFLKRHKLENVGHAGAKVTPDVLTKWFDSIEEYLKEEDAFHVLTDPERIFALDETSFSLCPESRRIVSPAGRGTPYRSCSDLKNEAITSLVLANAAGSFGPTMIVYPYKKIPEEICRSVPAAWAIGKSNNGCMTSEVFFEYFRKVFDSWLIKKQAKRPVIVFLDGRKSRMTLNLSEYCSSRGIILIALLANTKLAMRPLDVSVFGPLRLEWKNKVSEFKRKNNLTQLKRANLAPLLKTVLDDDENCANVVRGFRSCGIFPWTSENDYSKSLQKSGPSSGSDENGATEATPKPGDGNMSPAAALLHHIENFVSPDVLKSFQECEGESCPVGPSFFKVWKKLQTGVAMKDAENNSKYIQNIPAENEGLQTTRGGSSLIILPAVEETPVTGSEAVPLVSASTGSETRTESQDTPEESEDGQTTRGRSSIIIPPSEEIPVTECEAVPLPSASTASETSAKSACQENNDSDIAPSTSPQEREIAGAATKRNGALLESPTIASKKSKPQPCRKRIEQEEEEDKPDDKKRKQRETVETPKTEGRRQEHIHLTDNDNVNSIPVESGESTRSETKIQPDKYYAVYYDHRWYVGRALRVSGNNVEFKFLKQIMPGKFRWPGIEDRDTVDAKFIFFGPVEVKGISPFNVDVTPIDCAYKEIKKRRHL